MRLAGFEPTTPWFVAKYSIQLSYSRTAKHCNTFCTPDTIDQQLVNSGHLIWAIDPKPKNLTGGELTWVSMRP